MARSKSKRVKSANGAGSVTYHEKLKRWMARFTAIDPATGLRKRQTLYGVSEAEARGKLVKALNERNEGTLIVSSGRPITLQQWAERWMGSRRRRPSTMSTDTQALEADILPALGKLKLRDLRPVHVRGLMEAKLKAGGSPRTANKLREILRKVLNAVNREQPGMLPFNAAALAEPIPHYHVRKRAILEPEQVHELLELAATHRDGAFWTFVLATGARLGEGLGLAWDDVDLPGAQGYIRRELQYLKGEWLVLPPKTRKSKRPVPLAKVAVEALQRLKAAQAEQRLAAGPAWDREYGDLVFTTELGRPLDPSNIRRRLYKAEADLKLPQIGPHWLGRHGCASFLADQHVPAVVAMAILGHANIQTTLEIYSHALPKSMREAAMAIDRALTPEAKAQS